MYKPRLTNPEGNGLCHTRVSEQYMRRSLGTIRTACKAPGELSNYEAGKPPFGIAVDSKAVRFER